jgi:hypothetical protein
MQSTVMAPSESFSNQQKLIDTHQTQFILFDFKSFK